MSKKDVLYRFCSVQQEIASTMAWISGRSREEALAKASQQLDLKNHEIEFHQGNHCTF